MTDGFEIEYCEDENNTLIMKINSNHIPRVDDSITLNEKNFIVYSIKHIVNMNSKFEEKFIITVHKKKIKFRFS